MCVVSFSKRLDLQGSPWLFHLGSRGRKGCSDWEKNKGIRSTWPYWGRVRARSVGTHSWTDKDFVGCWSVPQMVSAATAALFVLQPLSSGTHMLPSEHACPGGGPFHFGAAQCEPKEDLPLRGPSLLCSPRYSIPPCFQIHSLTLSHPRSIIIVVQVKCNCHINRWLSDNKYWIIFRLFISIVSNRTAV